MKCGGVLCILCMLFCLYVSYTRSFIGNVCCAVVRACCVAAKLSGCTTDSTKWLIAVENYLDVLQRNTSAARRAPVLLL